MQSVAATKAYMGGVLNHCTFAENLNGICVALGSKWYPAVSLWLGVYAK
jgi:hypothetical protein